MQKLQQIDRRAQNYGAELRAAAQRQRDAEQTEQRRQVQRNEEAQQSRVRLAQADTRDRENQRRGESERVSEQQRREREAQQRDEQRRKEQQAEQERTQQREMERKREAAEKLAQKEAEKAEEQKTKIAYLSSMRQGIRLAATKCPDGEGHYYATGTVPKVKGSYCIDVHYQASCPGSRITSNGVAKNFIGMSGCFGDTYQIEPKPACPVQQVQMVVTDVRPGCN